MEHRQKVELWRSSELRAGADIMYTVVDEELLLDKLESHAQSHADALAFCYLGDGEEISESLTWRGLLDRARHEASRLVRGGHSDQVVLLPISPGLDPVVGFVACLYARAIPAPVPAATTDAAIHRLGRIAAQSRATAVLGSRGVGSGGLARLAQLAGVSVVPIYIDPETEGEPSTPRSRVSCDTTALVQYSSGSTGDPKGVLVTHGNVRAQALEFEQAAEYDLNSVAVSWLPLFHDMGLMTSVLLPIWFGIPSYLMPPEAFLKHPRSWLEAISRFGGTHTAAPNFAFELCARRIDEAATEDLDLSTLRMVINGAEPVRAETIERFQAKFGPSGFLPAAMCPGYGLAEATLKVSLSPAGIPPRTIEVDGDHLAHHRATHADRGSLRTSRMVSCGVPQHSTEIAIADPRTSKRLNEGEIGEIWVTGESVAVGYHRDPRSSQLTFNARLEGEDEGRQYLRTGDLGFILDHELYVSGRIKDLIIIRGVNYYPQAIEATVEETDEAVRAGHVVAFISDDDPSCSEVTIVAEFRREMRAEELSHKLRTIRERVNEHHGVAVREVVAAQDGEVARTTSGKVARNRCRERYLAGELAVLQQRTDSRGSKVEELLDWLRMWAPRRFDGALSDQRRTLPPHVVLDLGNQGLLGLQVDPELGGLGLSVSECCSVMEHLGAVDLTLASFVSDHNFLGVDVVSRFGDGLLADSWLPRLATGRALVAFAWTEPESSYSIGAMRTFLRRREDGTLGVDGSKVFSGSLAWAELVLVFALAPDEGAAGLGGACVAVPTQRSGVTVGPDARTMGLRGMTQNELLLVDVDVEASDILGGVGDAAMIAQHAMGRTRLTIAAMCVGAMRRAIQHAHAYASIRQVNTGSLVENAITIKRLSEGATAAAALSGLVRATAQDIDVGENVPESNLVALKCLGPELLWSVVDDAVQMMGGRGYTEVNDIARMFRDARALRILEGPTESMTMHLGSIVIERRSEVSGRLSALAGAPHIGERLEESIQAALAEHGNHSGLRISARQTSVEELRFRAGTAAAWAYLAAANVNPASPAQEPMRVWVSSKLEDALSALSSPSLPPTADADLKRTVDAWEDQYGPVKKACTSEGSAPAASSAPPRARQKDQHHSRPSPGAEWIQSWIAERSSMTEQQVDVDASPLRYGVDSVIMAQLVADAEGQFSVAIPAQAAWRYPTIRQLGLAIDEIVSGPAPTTVGRSQK